MNLLIIGGGVFLGQALLGAALENGHTVTVFNRGMSRQWWPPGVKWIVGDRTEDLHLLMNRSWDAVIDTCGYRPQDVELSAAALLVSRLCEQIPQGLSQCRWHHLAETGQWLRHRLSRRHLRHLKRTSWGYATNPNMGGVVMVGLGCEGFQIPRFKEAYKVDRERIFRTMTIQETGGTRKTVAQGVEAVRHAAACQRGEARDHSRHRS